MKNTFKEILKSFLPLAGTGLILLVVILSLKDYKSPDFTYLLKEDISGAVIAKAEEKTEEEEKEAAVNSVAFDIEDGSYEGNAMGYKGTIRLSVGINSGTISEIEILESHDDAAFFNRAVGVIDDIISNQSWEVDVVSGATYSSNGIKKAVENALTGKRDETKPVAKEKKGPSVKKAKESKDYEYKDGEFEGRGQGFAGDITVRVKIKKGKIKKIKILSYLDGDEYIKRAESVVKQIVNKQTTNVDVASGATYSSNGIIEAVRDALDKAKVKKAKKSEDSNNTEDREDTAEGNNDGDDKNSDSEDPSENSKDPTVVNKKYPYKDGIYEGTGEGFRGSVTVALEIKDSEIRDIVIKKYSDDEAFMKKASSLLTDIVNKQDIGVDTVSGATFSSKGLLEAVANAIKAAEQATNPPTAEAVAEETEKKEEIPVQMPDEEDDQIHEDYIYNDGDYVGQALCIPDEYGDFEPYNIIVNFSLKNDRIVNFTSIMADYEGDTNDVYFNWAIKGRGNSKGLESQLTGLKNVYEIDKVDVVSYATCSSKSIKAACQDALNKAIKQKKNEEE